MLKELRQNISTKESLLFCILGGIFVYFVCAIPLILFTLFPPTQPEGFSIQYYVVKPPLKYAFIASFFLFTILGIYFLKKIHLKNRLAHFSLLALLLGIGGGFLTTVLELFYYLFLIGDLSNKDYFFARLKENWFEALLYDAQIIGWLLLFSLILIPFTITFLTSTTIIKKFSKRNSLN